ncbi:MAG: cation transporter, partial [Hyphomicrobiales bacterium]
YRRALWLVIAINAVMFMVEIAAGLAAQSQALKADALDFLGDTATYTISLLVIGRSLQLRSRAALIKGLSLAAFGLWVAAATLYRVWTGAVPDAPVMSLIAVLAFAANLTSALVLMKYKDGDANVRSVWLCSRNDAIGNLAVLAAAGGVWALASRWPDLIVAALMSGLFLSSAWQIITQALAEHREGAASPAE